MTGSLGMGFADPVHDAQANFRAILDAMSRPGRIVQVTGVTPPPSLDPATAAALLTLTDHETKIWLDPRAMAAREWLAFHCGVSFTADLDTCAFAVALALPDLTQLPAGSHEEPETSATVICQVAGFGTGLAFRLTGPGLREPETLRIQGLPDDFDAIWQDNHALFPRGIDLILCAGDCLTALPRTVAIQKG